MKVTTISLKNCVAKRIVKISLKVLCTWVKTYHSRRKLGQEAQLGNIWEALGHSSHYILDKRHIREVSEIYANRGDGMSVQLHSTSDIFIE